MSIADVLDGKRRWWVECCDVLDGLRAMPSESVNCVVTSPPYWGLRDYGIEGQIGLEPTFPEYVAAMVALFTEVRRVLRKDGTLWLNVGDSYAGSWGAQSREGYGDHSSKLEGGDSGRARQIGAHPKMLLTGSAKKTPGLKPKDLIGAPWRLAFGLQDDGWWLRSAITWCKRAAMPESVMDRPSTATEMVFMLTRSPRYFYDADAVREPYSEGSLDRYDAPMQDVEAQNRQPGGSQERVNRLRAPNPLGRMLRNFWLLGPEPYPDAHFATFPTEIPRRCILAGCPKDGVVLDPFSGAGTTAMVALRHDRRAIGLELNESYCAMARKRIVNDAPMFNTEGAA